MKLTKILIITLLAVLFMAACAPTPPTATVAPTAEPTPTPYPRPFEIDLYDLPPGTKIVEVVGAPVPLRECSRYNASGFCVWGIFGKSVKGNRIIISQIRTWEHPAKLLVVYETPVKGDGGTFALELHPYQVVASYYVYFTSIDLEPIDWKHIDFDIFSMFGKPALYVLERHVEDYNLPPPLE
ncbi:MAG: hypothetical protein JRD89_17560 [Deltaproteobacteria bacterium]|nr:hypothetical protein [Deltaproteobacteria bacterium]